MNTILLEDKDFFDLNAEIEKHKDLGYQIVGKRSHHNNWHKFMKGPGVTTYYCLVVKSPKSILNDDTMTVEMPKSEIGYIDTQLNDYFPVKVLSFNDHDIKVLLQRRDESLCEDA